MWDHIRPDEICMVGDDVVQDIDAAQKAGIGTTLLVQTGKYRTGDETQNETNCCCFVH
jgi:ribonucleotide monophosphatase NagD (HAD superfamily)